MYSFIYILHVSHHVSDLGQSLDNKLVSWPTNGKKATYFDPHS